MNNPDYYLTHQLHHKYAGNGFYFVRNEPEPGYVLVARFSKDGAIGPNATAIAHVDMLTKFAFEAEDGSEQSIPSNEEIGLSLDKLRHDLESGKIVRKRGLLFST